MSRTFSIDNLIKVKENILKPICFASNIEAYLVGGCTRDILLGNGEVNDVDIVCNDAEQMVNALVQYCSTNDVKYSINKMSNGHATVVTVNYKQLMKDSFSIEPETIDFEISQFTDKKLSFGTAFRTILNNDAESRDFTCNAWYYPIHNNEKPFTPILHKNAIYPVIGNDIIPCNGSQTFINNPLRIFRAMDLISRGYRPTPELTLSISDALKSIYYSDELRKSMLAIVHKIFVGLAEGKRMVNDVIYAFNYMMGLGVWGKLIDIKIQWMSTCIHKNSYHYDSVWQHTMWVIKNLYNIGGSCELKSVQEHIIKPNVYDYWAAFLHDIGKVDTITFDDISCHTHFIDHQKYSVEIATGILRDSPVNSSMTNYILDLIKVHMDTKPFGDKPIPKSQFKHIRRLMWELGQIEFEHFLLLNHADCAASERSENKNTLNILAAMRYMKRHNEPCWYLYRIPINGNVIKDKIPEIPDKYIGKFIDQLYKVTFAHPENYETEEQCIHYLKSLINSGWTKESIKNK